MGVDAWSNMLSSNMGYTMDCLDHNDIDRVLCQCNSDVALVCAFHQEL